MKLIFAFLFLLSVSSCNLKVTEMAKTYVKVSYESDKCLKSFSTNMQAYLSAKISASDFKRFWLCFSNSIKIFSSVVQGREADQFTVEEIFTYISELIKKPIPVSDELVKEVILIKKWLLGGGDHITKTELKKLSSSLIEMTQPLLDLLEYMEIYNLFRKDNSVEQVLSKYSWKEIQSKLQESRVVLIKTFDKFAKFTPKTSYSVEHLKNSVVEIDLFFNGGERSLVSNFVDKHDELLEAMQALVLPNTTKIVGDFSVEEWKNLLSASSKSYMLFIEYKLTMQNKSLFNVNKLDYFVLWINRTFKFIEKTIKAQPNEVISYSRLVPVFEYFYNTKVLPLRIEERLLSIVLGKFFTSAEYKLIGASSIGLNLHSLGLIKDTLEKWARAQVIFSNSIDTKVELQLVEGHSVSDLVYYDELLSVTKKSIYVFQSKRNAYLLEGDLLEKKSPYNLFTHNTLLSLARRVFHAYSSPKQTDLEAGVELKLSPKEIQNLVQDAFFMLESFGVTVPVGVEGASLLARVLAQFFSYSSKGAVVETKREYVECVIYCEFDELDQSREEVISRKLVSEALSFSELLDFLSIVNASLQRAEKDFLLLSKECESNCIDFFLAKVESSTDFPILKKYFTQGSQSSKTEFFSLLREKIFLGSQVFTKAKLFSAYAMLYFIESVMLKYDKDKSGVLEEEELEEAFVVFEGLVIKLLESGGSDTDIASVKQAFHFALTMPTEASIWKKIGFVFNPPPLKADPLSLARILATIISQGK